MTLDKRSPLVSIADFDAGVEFLTQLPLANPMLAEQKIAHFLDALLSKPLDPESNFRLFEQARVPQFFVAEEMTRSYTNRPLPLASDEVAAFQLVVSAWRRMEKAFASCARIKYPVADPRPEQRARVATILHRCISYVSSAIFEHYRARQEVPKGLWSDLHNYLVLAEAWGVSSEPVGDPLDPAGQTAHCMSAYVAALLIDVASPFSQSLRDLNLIRRWAGMWAPLASILALDPELPPPAYVVDFNKDAALQPISQASKNGVLRQLETSRIGMKINQVQDQLRHRISPAQAGLGEETFGHASQLLDFLTRPWTKGESPRRFRRFASMGKASIVADFPGMFFHVMGQEFDQPVSAPTYTRRDYDHIFTFGERVDAEVPEVKKALQNYPLEYWEVQNHSANGFRLRRPQGGLKLSHGQLIALQPHDGEQFILAMITWLTQINNEGALEMGLHTLPGVPDGIGVRIVSPGTASFDKFVPAFSLPGLPAMHEEPSLVLPSGFYQASRPLEIYKAGANTWKAKLLHVLQRGQGFDRVSYEPV